MEQKCIKVWSQDHGLADLTTWSTSSCAFTRAWALDTCYWSDLNSLLVIELYSQSSILICPWTSAQSNAQTCCHVFCQVQYSLPKATNHTDTSNVLCWIYLYVPLRVKNFTEITLTNSVIHKLKPRNMTSLLYNIHTGVYKKYLSANLGSRLLLQSACVHHRYTGLIFRRRQLLAIFEGCITSVHQIWYNRVITAGRHCLDVLLLIIRNILENVIEIPACSVQ